MPTGGSSTVLVERRKLLEQLDDLLMQSARGRGAIAAVSGSTAMGKTTVLNALAERATAAGSTVLGVVSSPHERDVPYSALAQLFHAIDARSVPPVAQGDSLAVAHHTYQVIADLAARRPLLITVDDIQHTDTASLSCLRYVAQRLNRLPLALVFTRGVSVEEQPPRILHDLLYRTSVRRFHLGPLSRAGVRELSPTPPADRFITEIHTLSGGNPLLAQALIEEHRLRATPESTAGAAPSEGDATAPLPDGGMAIGPVFQQAVLAYLHRIGPRAVLLARCVALLDEAATPLLLSRLSGIDTELLKRYLRLLTGIGVLNGARLRHAGVRQAVLGEMPHGEATELRYRAARLLYDSGAPPQPVAAQLLGAGPLHEDWVLDVLRDAACQALNEGDVHRGIRCLELARECCVDEGQRLAVKSQYACGQWQLRPADSAPHFLALKGPIVEGKLTGNDALWAAEGMLFHLGFDEALVAIDHLNDGDEEMATALHGTRMLMASEVPGVLDRLSRPLPDTAAPAMSHSELRARHALALVLERGADEYAIALAEQVFQSSQNAVTSQLSSLPKALLALCYADRLDAAAKWHDHLAGDAGRHDAPAWRAQIACVGALVSLRRGRLADAVRQAETAYARLSGPRWNVSSALALAILVEAHTAMGDHQAAAGYLAPEPPPELFLTRAGLHYLYARGRHHLATGNTYLALSDFQGCGSLMRRWNVDTPAVAPWRLGEAEAWLRLGDRERAARLVEKQLARPDTGLARSRGMALHGLALVQPTAQQPPVLRDAFRLLESCGARYEAATVLADLSRAYQQLGDKRARPTARRAWRLAKSCQAEPLCQELLPTSTPRSIGTRGGAGSGESDRTDQGGFGGLSESERRVAMLAAQGYANREIADRLFITVSTVEQHLTRVYRKMGIRNREQLLQGAHAVSYESA
ncbi:AAA family ATPase [Streptomyces botrytidirepellens]|uniref:LuxR family transcriptional regulator n=1 Tax=Streptomyces botrytidirepellens TaxID=2486417 RepID=A0A3M8VT42_9ACTN|nr:LuxR family transcriptional regulator [Streptomyces botrytidirepellens]RNG19445.1 LuxR family transcriptional regulator [Streptomyces botrytidirepellens]